MNQITIVTAFFDIGRSDFTKLKRDNSTYFNQFSYWASIRNDVVAFCGSQEHKEKIEEIRGTYGLQNKTKVIVIEDITQIYPDQYHMMEVISKDAYYDNFRLLKNTLSAKPLYDLVNYLKMYFMKEAKNQFSITNQIAWMDFSFNHGGSNYPNKSDFNFIWEYDCKGKAHFFYEEELDNRPMFEVIRTVKPDPMLGAMFIIPSELIDLMWNSYLGCINSMLDMGMIDDDQPLLLMVYRKNMDKCTAIKCRNCEQISLCGGKHMKYVRAEKKFKTLRKIKRFFTKRFDIISYHIHDYKILVKTRD